MTKAAEMNRKPRVTWRLGDQSMKAETFDRLYAELERQWPGRVRRVIEVCPVAVVKTIDNERDAQQTLANFAAKAK